MIKEIIVKTKVESERKEMPKEALPEELVEKLKEDILKELGSSRLQDLVRKER